jgi:hypothetical protein
LPVWLPPKPPLAENAERLAGRYVTRLRRPRPAVAAYFASLVNWHELRKTLRALGFLGVTYRFHPEPEVSQFKREARL